MMASECFTWLLCNRMTMGNCHTCAVSTHTNLRFHLMYFYLADREFFSPYFPRFTRSKSLSNHAVSLQTMQNFKQLTCYQQHRSTMSQNLCVAIKCPLHEPWNKSICQHPYTDLHLLPGRTHTLVNSMPSLWWSVSYGHRPSCWPCSRWVHVAPFGGQN